MPTYTLELNQVIESIYGTDEDPSVYEQAYDAVTFDGITYGKLPVLPEYTSLGLGTYPLFDENYRKVLNGKIIDEYYNREIGTETIDNFLLNIRKKMDQIMPYYNQLYETQRINFDPMKTMDILSVGNNTMEGTEKVDGTTTTNAKTTSGARVIGSDFPQTMLAGDADYATNGTDSNSGVEVDSDVVQDSGSTSNTKGNSDSHVTGYQGNASNLLMQYRASLLNIDTMILADIETCFMLLLNNGDEYFARESLYGWW